MNRSTFTKSFFAAALALGALTAGSMAHARTDVTLIVGANPGLMQPGPVFVQHRNATLHPESVDRTRQQVQFTRDRSGSSGRGGPHGDADRDGVPNLFDRDSRFYDARATRRHVQWGDFDRDGVVNQFDRAPRNPHRH